MRKWQKNGGAGCERHHVGRRVRVVTTTINKANLKGFTTTSNVLYLSNDEDNDGLQLEERKEGEVFRQLNEVATIMATVAREMDLMVWGPGKLLSQVVNITTSCLTPWSEGEFKAPSIFFTVFSTKILTTFTEALLNFPDFGLLTIVCTTTVTSDPIDISPTSDFHPASGDIANPDDKKGMNGGSSLLMTLFMEGRSKVQYTTKAPDESRQACNTSQKNKFILQETCLDSSGAFVVYCTLDLPSINKVMSSEDPPFIPFLSSGFAISPDAGGKSDVGEISIGSLVTVVVQTIVSNPKSGKLSKASVNVVKILVENTVKKIEGALNSPI
ncbi:hypothetical protein POM88_038032 [Heracleum sosnowskyi]|uniref:HD-Zip IV C-terminal domain-containing protein n=1 Tax=Heracleum sosnowskyi TaxID=360622 RepID=A0AAD8MDT6_9APIA|nr:hypothetical protein POM88_038032 [Heracleum sosnowskyi]